VISKTGLLIIFLCLSLSVLLRRCPLQGRFPTLGRRVQRLTPLCCLKFTEGTSGWATPPEKQVRTYLVAPARASIAIFPEACGLIELPYAETQPTRLVSVG
jgi:hypothetical protein